MRELDIGGGDNPVTPNCVVMDPFYPKADVKHDANKAPYPFKENEFDNVYLKHVVEHLEPVELKDILREIRRITKPKGIIKIWTPHASNIVGVWSNIEHRRPFVYNSFNFGDTSKKHHEKENYASEHLWNVKKVEIHFGVFHRILGVSLFANKFPMSYEQLLFGIFPAREIYYELEIVK